MAEKSIEVQRVAPRIRIREIGLKSLLKHAFLATTSAPDTGDWDPVMDLNRFGVAFRTRKDLDVSHRIVVTLWIADKVPRIELTGEVVWVRPENEDERSVGVQFSDYRRWAWRVLQDFDRDFGAAEEGDES